MKGMPTCKETSVLASRAMDERLSFTDRMAMWLHLAICKNCARFGRHLHEMRHIARAETEADGEATGLTDEGRRRIATRLPIKPDS